MQMCFIGIRKHMFTFSKQVSIKTVENRGTYSSLYTVQLGGGVQHCTRAITTPNSLPMHAVKAKGLWTNVDLYVQNIICRFVFGHDLTNLTSFFLYLILEKTKHLSHTHTSDHPLCQYCTWTLRPILRLYLYW